MKNLKPFRASYPVPVNLNQEDCYPFDVSCLKSKDWDNSPDVLFVIEHVDSGDIKAGELLVTSPAKDVFEFLLDNSASFYKMMTGKNPKPYNKAVINFNYHRNYNLKGIEYEVSLTAAAKRTRKLINMLKPKTVVVFGKTAASWILDSDFTDSGVHFGIPKTLNTGKHVCNYIALPTYHNTIMRLDEDASEDDYDKAIAHANLIGFISRMLASIYENRMLLSYDLKPNYKWLKTYEEIDEYLTMLENLEKPFSMDTETTGLFNYGLKLSTIQFATSPKVGVIIAVAHKDSPFANDKKTLIKVYKRLQEFFAIRKPKTYIVGHNLGYDFRVLRQVLKLPIIYWNAWDTMAGEHALDENLSKLDSRLLTDKKGSRNFALDKTCLRYGMTWYTTADFGKSQRHLIHESDLTDDVLKYCFHGDVLVSTDKGLVPIKDLVCNFTEYKALSYNHCTQELEYKTIVASSVTIPKEPVIELQFEGGTLTVTESHEVWCVNKNAYIAVRDIELGDEVLIHKEP